MNASSVFLSVTMLATCVLYGLYVVFCKPNTIRRSVFAIAYLIYDCFALTFSLFFFYMANERARVLIAVLYSVALAAFVCLIGFNILFLIDGIKKQVVNRDANGEGREF